MARSRPAALVIAVLLTLGACTSNDSGDGAAPSEQLAETDTTAPDVDSNQDSRELDQDPECHFATTIPGGELPQPQCPPDEAPDPDAEVEKRERWTCPDEDYPIVVASTSWSAFLSAPDPIPLCGGGTLSDLGTTVLLFPTEPLAGLDPNASLGMSQERQPGGRFLGGYLSIPAQGDELIRFESTMIGDGFPPDAVSTWVDDEFFRICPNTAVPLTIRGNAGCQNGDTYAWMEGQVSYTVAIRVEVTPEDAVTWLDSWEQPS